jgi:hypothetical protein
MLFLVDCRRYKPEPPKGLENWLVVDIQERIFC